MGHHDHKLWRQRCQKHCSKCRNLWQTGIFSKKQTQWKWLNTELNSTHFKITRTVNSSNKETAATMCIKENHILACTKTATLAQKQFPDMRKAGPKFSHEGKSVLMQKKTSVVRKKTGILGVGGQSFGLKENWMVLLHNRRPASLHARGPTFHFTFHTHGEHLPP